MWGCHFLSSHICPQKIILGSARRATSLSANSENLSLLLPSEEREICEEFSPHSSSTGTHQHKVRSFGDVLKDYFPDPSVCFFSSAASFFPFEWSCLSCALTGLYTNCIVLCVGRVVYKLSYKFEVVNLIDGMLLTRSSGMRCWCPGGTLLPGSILCTCGTLEYCTLAILVY